MEKKSIHFPFARRGMSWRRNHAQWGCGEEITRAGYRRGEEVASVEWQGVEKIVRKETGHGEEITREEGQAVGKIACKEVGSTDHPESRKHVQQRISCR